MGVVGGADGGRRTLHVGVRVLVVVVVPDVASSFGGCDMAAVSWSMFKSTMGGAAAPPVAEAGVTGTAAMNLRDPPAQMGIIILDSPL